MMCIIYHILPACCAGNIKSESFLHLGVPPTVSLYDTIPKIIDFLSQKSFSNLFLPAIESDKKRREIIN